MTIDEAKSMLIARASCIDNQCKGIYEDCNESLCDNCFLCYAQGTNGEQIKLLRQCAEWLEELKAYKEIGTVEGYKSAIECYTEEYNRRKSKEQYNKAIDDFICNIEKDARYEHPIEVIEVDRCRYIAEQLKVGDIDGKNY